MKNLKLIVFAIIPVFHLPLQMYAQNFSWADGRTHNITANPDFAGFPSTADNAGNSLIASVINFKTSLSLNFIGDYSLRKYDHNGSLLFNKTFLGKLLIDNIQTDSYRNIYISGIFMDTLKIDSVNLVLNTGSGFNQNHYVIKFNEAGDLLWKKNINEDYSANYLFGGLKAKGDFLYAGIGRFSQYYIKKFDQLGNEIQSIAISSPAAFGLSSIDIDVSGNIIAGGFCSLGNLNFGGHSVSSTFDYNVFIAKFSPSGNGIWAKFIQDVTFQTISISCDNTGNIFAAGDLSGSFLFGTIQTQGPQWVYDFFLTKLDPAGNFLWVREVPTGAIITGDASRGRYNCISSDHLNNVYLIGSQRGTVNWGNNVITISSGYSDILLLKFDQDGNILSGTVAGGPGADRADEITIDDLGNYYLSGNFSTSASFGNISVTGSGNINSFLTEFADGSTFGRIKVSSIIEGFYDAGINEMRTSDTLRFYLRDSNAPYAVADSGYSVIDPVTFECRFIILNAETGSYYLQLCHRNSLETWSSVPVKYSIGENSIYDFTSSESNAFGNNMALVDEKPLRFALYSGDVNQDELTDLSDLILILNDANIFAAGYISTDVNGDNKTDLSDLLLTHNNVTGFKELIRP